MVRCDLNAFWSASSGGLFLSASSSGYANTNYYFDDSLGPGLLGLAALQGVTSNGVPSSAVTYNPRTNGPHLTRGTNVAGYYTTGSDGGQGAYYYTNVTFAGSSGWYVIETVDSYNGLRDNSGSGQGYFLQWFSPGAFGGTNYSSTPVGAVSHVDEPWLAGVEDSAAYFGLWAGGKAFGTCAWSSRRTTQFQAVGDPFTTR